MSSSSDYDDAVKQFPKCSECQDRLAFNLWSGVFYCDNCKREWQANCQKCGEAFSVTQAGLIYCPSWNCEGDPSRL